MATVTRRYAADRLSWAHTDLFKAKLDPFSFLVFSYLAARADSNGRAWPKQATIADDCGISERQVRNCVEKLVEGKLVVVLEQSGTRGGRRSVYYIATRNEWLAGKLLAESQPANAAGSQDDSEDPNRQAVPVQPANAAGSLYKGSISKEVDPNKGDDAPLAPSPMSAEAVFAGALEAMQKRKGGKAPKAPKKEKHADPKSFLVEAPAEFRQSDEFVEAWDGWGQNRIEAKNPLNQRAARIALGKLAKHDLKTAIEALQRATMNNWTGVFPESIASGASKARFGGSSSEQVKQDFGDW